ncbi:MAG TPA: helix-turn-helix transcriptional regulator [Clostridiaceae bacterium]|nr:helix-turn-helix transcriptional regulator [Clostridiaceae bacterium]
MVEYTVGRKIYPGYVLKLNCVGDYSPDKVCRYNCFRIIMVEGGTGSYEINGKSDMYKGPSVFCLNENDEAEITIKNGFRTYTVFFHPNVINKAFELDNIRLEPSPFRDTDHQDLYLLSPFIKRTEAFNGFVPVNESQSSRMFQLAIRTEHELMLQKDKDWPCRSRSFLFQILFLIQQAYEDLYTANIADSKMNIGNQSELIQKVILYLNLHYEEKITLPGLSREFNINRTSLENQFIKATGMPVIAYLISLRLKMAATFLRETLLPVSEIIGRSGFKDRSHFVRIFKKYLGLTPYEYRKKYCRFN